jgi:hypothetical protein
MQGALFFGRLASGFLEQYPLLTDCHQSAMCPSFSLKGVIDLLSHTSVRVSPGYEFE